MNDGDLGSFSMVELFRVEAENHISTLTGGLLALERDPTSPEQLEACMRAAHSFKGAARIVGLGVAVSVAHALEDCFVAAQHGTLALGRAQIDGLLGGVDLLARIGRSSEAEVGQWEKEQRSEVDAVITRLTEILAGQGPSAPAPEPGMPQFAEAPAPHAESTERGGGRFVRSCVAGDGGEP